MADTPSDLPDFEKSLDELETLVERMEAGELTLEESLAHFERGMALSKRCQAALETARLKVEQLLSSEDGNETVPFEDRGE